MAAIAQITQEEEIGRGDLTDAQWVKLKPLLPPQKARTGKPAKDHRQIINGILWILRTGAPWRDLPDRRQSIALYQADFIDGDKQDMARKFWQNFKQLPITRGELIGKSISETVQ